ncbi:GNAT family N-acetyltransferase [Umezawaea endophytica]|uniref:GNAT family N-acetyltransferase n=1 Tax=Umezawaea endophytica TaxID=1654476 RepID=A0A9X2VWC2_9PSEU|nr:GNAT family N-acetyltransferase [Umezawaea endophytica]MCS7483874.1 GNAT family N-acetyltransferase [Umezawaea endophytica]
MNELSEITLLSGGAEVARSCAEEIRTLYDDTFSKAPFEWLDSDSETHHREFEALLREETFSVVVGRFRGELVAFAYGFALPVDHRWWAGFSDDLPADLVLEYPGRTFALIDLAVSGSCRGRGWGGRVVSRLLDGRREERAILSVQPAAVDTQSIYRHWGWTLVGRKGPIDGASPPYWDIFVKPISG